MYIYFFNKNHISISFPSSQVTVHGGELCDSDRLFLLSEAERAILELDLRSGVTCCYGELAGRLKVMLRSPYIDLKF